MSQADRSFCSLSISKIARTLLLLRPLLGSQPMGLHSSVCATCESRCPKGRGLLRVSGVSAVSFSHA